MNARRGFTLIEMLVVIGIIATLAGVSMTGYSVFINRAQRARAVELVSNAHTALCAVLQKEDSWPRAILAEGASGNGEMTAQVGASLARRGVMSLTYRKVERDGANTYELVGLDRLGIVDPWAQAVIKRNPDGAADGTRVPEGGTIADHRLRFAIDDDYDGYTQVSVSANGKGSAKVRASACVWCAGRDGKFGTKDDVYSWQPRQEVK